MEIIIVVLLFIFGGAIWNAITSAGSSAIKASQGKGSFSENMRAQQHGLDPLSIRKESFQAGEDGDGFLAIGIEIKGEIPVSRTCQLGYITSVIDVTDEENSQIVLSELETFQEPESRAYQYVQKAGTINPNEGYISWVRAGVVLPDVLYPAYGGNRKLQLILRIVDMNNMPPIECGFGRQDHPGMFALKVVGYELAYEGQGFMEASENKDEARALAIRLGIAIAIADGNLADSEGNVIKHWITKTLAVFNDSKRKHLKEIYNDALRSAYIDAKAGELSLSEVTGRLNEIAEEPQKYEAIELCFDVMAADGVVDKAEMDSIRKIAQALELDYDEIERLKDKRLVELDVTIDQQASIESILGIDEHWDASQIKVHIRSEFAKWNGRLNNLPEGQERENAQRMLDMLSEARKKYA